MKLACKWGWGAIRKNQIEYKNRSFHPIDPKWLSDLIGDSMKIHWDFLMNTIHCIEYIVHNVQTSCKYFPTLSFQILGCDPSSLHTFPNHQNNWHHDCPHLGHFHHRIFGTTLRLERSWFWKTRQHRKTMYCQPRFELPDFCHHVHILCTLGHHIAFILANFHDS